MGAFGKALHFGSVAYFSASMYQEQREQGASKLGAAARSGVDLFLSSVAMGPYMAAMLAPAIASGGTGIVAYKQRKEQFYKMASSPGFLGRGFLDTSATYTMRQRGVQAISMSRMNARNSLGNEAAMMAGSVRY